MSRAGSGPARTIVLPARSELMPYAAPAAVAAVFGIMAWAHRWLHEDGLINIRVVENLVVGNGPVYNAGERVEAFTSPAQVVLLALGRWVTLGVVPIETVVFVLGVGASVAGLCLAMRGSMHLWAADVRGRFTVPLGAAAFVAVPLTWDFATSGHEGSVGYAWIGLSFFAMSRRVREFRVDLRPPIDKPRWTLAVIGSGVLVRPEFALYTAAFLLCWWLLHRDAAGSWKRALAWALGPTLIYQVFRMGYYGLVLPNTALAKLGGPIGMSQGLHYLTSFTGPFLLWLPLVLLAAVLAALVADADRQQRLVVAAFIVPALMNVAYLVSIGGDYVNGRLLVVPLFSLLAPISVLDSARFVPSAGRVHPVLVGCSALVLLWASGCATTMRPPWNLTSKDFLDAKYDAREIAVRRWVGRPPTRVDDYRESFLAGPYKVLVVQYASADGDLLVVDDPFMAHTILLAPGAGPALASPTIGALGAVAGLDVRIIDRLALADPVASHLPAEGDTAGHLRKLPTAWVFARAGLVAGPDSAAAVKALGCGRLAQLMSDTTDPMTPRRFLTNVVHSLGNTRVIVPKDPDEAVAKFC